MIKFIPILKQVKSPVDSPTDYSSNISNLAIAKQCEKQFGFASCKWHPDFENEMIVNFKKNESIMVISKSCCARFEKRLMKLAQTKNPFKGAKSQVKIYIKL